MILMILIIFNILQIVRISTFVVFPGHNIVWVIFIPTVFVSLLASASFAMIYKSVGALCLQISSHQPYGW